MANVHIVIPTYNNWQLTHKLLWDLYKHERENISTVLVVDDCSPDEEVQQGLKWWIGEDLLPVYQKKMEENVGFLRACNSGLQICEKLPEDDVVILISNDVQVFAKFISDTRGILEENPKSLIGGVLYSNSTGWNTFSGVTYPYLEGWYLATSVAGWRDLGYFDERFAPHIFEDIDLSTMAVERGYQLVPLNNPGMKHLSGQTIKYTEERHELTRKNQEKFKLKWTSEN